eukprot:m.1095027 g.1095027  ORF g.1095027 m.1095027 type:complete len:104 (-) comp24303_c1_seq19:802-1113(-)
MGQKWVDGRHGADGSRHTHMRMCRKHKCGGLLPWRRHCRRSIPALTHALYRNAPCTCMCGNPTITADGMAHASIANHCLQLREPSQPVCIFSLFFISVSTQRE